jgi:tellurite resistance protein TerC
VDIGPATWWLTIGGIALIFAFDFLVTGRRPHVVAMREAAVSVAAYVAVAIPGPRQSRKRPV